MNLKQGNAKNWRESFPQKGFRAENHEGRTAARLGRVPHFWQGDRSEGLSVLFGVARLILVILVQADNVFVGNGRRRKR